MLLVSMLLLFLMHRLHILLFRLQKKLLLRLLLLLLLHQLLLHQLLLQAEMTVAMRVQVLLLLLRGHQMLRCKEPTPFRCRRRNSGSSSGQQEGTLLRCLAPTRRCCRHRSLRRRCVGVH